MISSNGYIATVSPAKVSDNVLRQPLLLEKEDASKNHFRTSVGKSCRLDGTKVWLHYMHRDVNKKTTGNINHVPRMVIAAAVLAGAKTDNLLFD